MKIATAANRGDRLLTLKALRQKIARTLDATDSGRDIAALSRQLQLVLDEIDEIEKATPPETPKTVLEAILEKRAAEKRAETIADAKQHLAEDPDTDEQAAY